MLFSGTHINRSFSLTVVLLAVLSLLSAVVAPVSRRAPAQAAEAAAEAPAPTTAPEEETEQQLVQRATQRLAHRTHLGLMKGGLDDLWFSRSSKPTDMKNSIKSLMIALAIVWVPWLTLPAAKVLQR